MQLVGIFDATRDVNTALDESCFSMGREAGGREEEEELLLACNFTDLHRSVEEEILRESQQRVAPNALVERTLELISRWQALGDGAERVELEAKTRLQLFANKQIRSKENKLQVLEELATALQAYSRARNCVAVIGDVNLSVEKRVESLLDLVRVSHKPKTRFSAWLRGILDFYGIKLKLLLQDETVAQVKRTNLGMFQQQQQRSTMLAEPLNRTRHLVSLCIRLQLAMMTTTAAAILGGGANRELFDRVWGIEFLAKPVLMRFQFHFCSPQSPTNRLDRPEWFVGFIIESIRDRASFIQTHLQPHSCLEVPGAVIVVVDVLAHFIRCLVLAAHARLEASWRALLGNDALLSHTIDELLVGDRALVREFGYALQQRATAWPLLCSGFFQGERAEHWFQSDLKFARARMRQELLATDTAWVSNITTEYSECTSLVITLVDMLGQRAHLEGGDHAMTTALQARYADSVQSVLLREFIDMCIARPDASQRLNALLPLQDALRTWQLRGNFLLDTVLELVEVTLQEQLEEEVNAQFFAITSLLREWERKRWTAHLSTAAHESFPAVQLCGKILLAWRSNVNTVCRAKLERALAHKLETYFVEFVLRRQFANMYQFSADFQSFAELFTGKAARFARMRALLHVLQTYSRQELLSAADDDGQVLWRNDDFFDDPVNLAALQALAITPKQVARVLLEEE